MRTNITSAAGIIALLEEPEPEVKVFALNKLNEIVNEFWPEISEAVDKFEMLYEDESFKQRNLAAYVASKVYYHLGAYEESLTYALGANELFNVNEQSEYVETTVAKCIDHYTKLRIASLDDPDAANIDPRLEAIVNKMFQQCFDDKCFKQAVGIALETRRIDIFEKAILSADSVQEMLSYSVKVCMALIQNRQFRTTVLRVLVKLYMGLESPDYISVCQCLIFLDDPQAVAEILEKLIRAGEDSTLVGYQIGFDLYESATQQFLQRIQASLRATAPIPIPTGTPASTETDKNKDKEGVMETDQPATEEPTAESEPPKVETPKVETLSETDKVLQEKITKLGDILGGDMTISLHLQFLIRTNKTDLLILKNTKEAVRNSICHNATVIANAFMHSGTTSDQFLRDNLEWLGRATNWAKFTATASLGVVHRGHEKEALSLMSTYLPKDSSSSSAYSEGGGLYALGLIHANHGGEITEYLINQLKEATSEMVRHGGCLGLGLAAMGTARQDVYELLKLNLNQDDAVTGEAAGIAMGLVMMGTKSANAIEEMISYAQETQHEKILRGLAVGIAMTMFGRLEEADTLVESLSRDKDPILRWSGMYTVAMAYCGTGNNQAIRKLLHVAVSDVNDDVRRAAVTSLGFLLFRTPEQCPSVVSLLSESYNPHVRYGAAMALGIACSGTGLKEALGLLEPMTNDPVNYVRQGALIASAMVLVQHNDVTCSKAAHFRQMYAKVISDKHEDIMAKFGAILAQGIIEAGGRNVSMTLQSRTGHTNMLGIVGTLVFCQFWYWYPLTHFLALAFVPTTVIGLNADLKMPKIDLKSNAKPSTFAYPPPLEEKKDKKGEKVETAVLSITAKQKKKDAEKQKEKDSEKMDVDEETKDADQEKSSKDKDAKKPEAMEATVKTEDKEKSVKTEDKEKSVKTEDKEKSVKTEDKGKSEKTEKEKEKEGEKVEEKKEEKKEPEPPFEMLSNPARVMKAQLRVLIMPEGRYTPLKDISNGGIIMLKDTKPGEEAEIIEAVPAGGPKIEEEGDEPEPPEPFEWIED